MRACLSSAVACLLPLADGEAIRKMGILCLLYNRRRSNPEDPGMCPREHPMFTMRYLKDRDRVGQDESSDFFLTGTTRASAAPRETPASA